MMLIPNLYDYNSYVISLAHKLYYACVWNGMITSSAIEALLRKQALTIEIVPTLQRTNKAISKS